MSVAISGARIVSGALSPDIFVIGGGPAGLATAILAAQNGFQVAVADQNRPPIDKTCGEGLMPDAWAAMKMLGINAGSHESVPFRGICFHDANGPTRVQADFAQGLGLGLCRSVLHAKLVERAAELGVVLLWGSRVRLAPAGQVYCEARPVHCKWLIGADGESSHFRKWAALQQTRYEHVRFAARRHFGAAPWSDFVEVYWARDCQIVVAPVAPDKLCVAVTSRNPRLRFHEAISQVPALASRLLQVPVLDNVRGARAALRRLRRVSRGRLALVGDASGSVDPLTGEGLGLGFRQAAVLVDAMKSDNLRSYQAAHDRISAAPRLMSRLMLMMDAHPRLRRRALRILAAEPSLFSRLLNVNVGALTISNFGAAHALRFGWRMLTTDGEL
jgi:flavin-dependent dehydrogenase